MSEDQAGREDDNNESTCEIIWEGICDAGTRERESMRIVSRCALAVDNQKKKDIVVVLHKGEWVEASTLSCSGWRGEDEKAPPTAISTRIFDVLNRK